MTAALFNTSPSGRSYPRHLLAEWGANASDELSEQKHPLSIQLETGSVCLDSNMLGSGWLCVSWICDRVNLVARGLHEYVSRPIG